VAAAVAKRIDEIEPRVVHWGWRERLPTGALTAICGQPAGGKSMFTAAAAVELSCAGVDVLIFASEDPAHEIIRPRIEAAGGNLTRIWIADRTRFPSGMDYLEQTVLARNPGLVIIDPVVNHLDRGLNRSSDSMRLATDPLHDFAERTGVMVLLVEHVLKSISKNAHPLSAVPGGGGGLRGSCRTIYVGGKDPGDSERVVMCCIKMNFGEEPKPLAFGIDERDYIGADGRSGPIGFLRFREELDKFDVMSLLVKPSNNKPGRPPRAREEAARFIARLLHDIGPPYEREAGGLQDDGDLCGHASRTMRRAATDSLGIEPERRGSEVWWRLPDAIVARMDAGEDVFGD
jgi:hypothetical protein